MMVAVVLPFELALPFITGYGSTTFIFELVLFILLTPIVMAGFAGATVSKANPFGREVYGVTPFTATRPLTSAQLIAAKLKMAILSTLAAWVVVLVAVPLGFAWSGADAVLIEWARWGTDTLGAARTIVLALLVLGGSIVTTWMMLVQGLYLGLTGREWIVKTSGFVGLVIVMVIGPTFEWISDNADVQALAVGQLVDLSSDPRRAQDDGRDRDRETAFPQRFDQRSCARGWRRGLGGDGLCPLRCLRVVGDTPMLPRLPLPVDRDPRSAAGEDVGRAAGAGLEPASVTAS